MYINNGILEIDDSIIDNIESNQNTTANKQEDEHGF